MMRKRTSYNGLKVEGRRSHRKLGHLDVRVVGGFATPHNSEFCCGHF